MAQNGGRCWERDSRAAGKRPRRASNLGRRAGANGLSNRCGCFLDGDFPIAAILDAGAEVALLRALLDDERRAALRTWLVDGLVRSGEIAVWITAAAVENSATAFAARGAATDKFAFVALGAFDAERDRPRVLAFRIAGAADEFAEAAVLLDEAVAAESAFFIERFIGRYENEKQMNRTQVKIGFTVASPCWLGWAFGTSIPREIPAT